MRILFYVHLYPPEHNAGAEWMAHSIARWLQQRGHDVQVVVRDGRSTTFQDIRILKLSSAELIEAFRDCDVAITHLDVTREAMILARQTRRPLVHLVHNDQQLRTYSVRPDSQTFAVFNSAWLERAARWSGRKMVLHPPVYTKDYRVKRKANSDSLTLINLFATKGADLFWELSRLLPDRAFIAVKGGYGQQVIPDTIPRNVTVVENTPAIRDVYARTRLLLMPSHYESWGRTAIEAGCSGIPTLASPTPGLLESLGAAGKFVSIERPSDWVKAIEMFDDAHLYNAYSHAALSRAKELDPVPQLQRFEKQLDLLKAAPLTHTSSRPSARIPRR